MSEKNVETKEVNNIATDNSAVKENPKKITLHEIEKEIMAKQTPGVMDDFKVGDTVRVYYKIIEGDKQRIQPYEGIVIAIKHGMNRKSFIVRRVSYGVGIERIFPYNCPNIEKVEIVRKGRVRRAKLYYLRNRKGRSAVIREKVTQHGVEEVKE